MPTTISIDLVTTEDAAPTTAPHRISAQPGKDTATVQFTPTHDGVIVPADEFVPRDDIYPGKVLDIIAYTVRLGGSSYFTGIDAGSRGVVCDENLVCDDNLACDEYTLASGTQVTETITYSETGAPADGVLDVLVYVNTDAQGWS